MDILSFVSQSTALETSAKVYIRERIKTNGEITVRGDKLVIPFYHHFTGESINLAVKRIKEESVVGWTEDEKGVEVNYYDLADGSIFYIADYVAEKYDTLKTY